MHARKGTTSCLAGHNKIAEEHHNIIVNNTTLLHTGSVTLHSLYTQPNTRTLSGISLILQ
jgi:hypothetical protein